jgi:hypothetical protein
MKTNLNALRQAQQTRRNREFLRNTNPGIRAMVHQYHQLYRTKAEVAEAAKWLRYRHDERQEPNNLETHMRVDELLQSMLQDFQQLIGSHYIRRITKAESNE